MYPYNRFAIIAAILQFDYNTTKCVIKVVTISLEGARERHRKRETRKITKKEMNEIHQIKNADKTGPKEAILYMNNVQRTGHGG